MSRALKLKLLKVGAVLLIFLLGFSLFEFVGRMVIKDKLRNFLFVHSPESIDHRLPRNAKYGINSDGIRSLHEADYFTEDQYNIMVLGDSFAFGWALPADRAFPAVLEQMLREAYPGQPLNVINCGWISASPVLQYRLLRDVADKYHPDLVIQAFDMTDFHDDIKYQYMFAKRGIYWWYDKIPCTLYLLFEYAPAVGFWLYNLGFDYTLPEDRFFPCARPLGETRPLLQPAVDNLIRLDSLCHEKESRFLTIIFPRAFQYSTAECKENWENESYEIMGPHVLEPFNFFDRIKDTIGFPLVSFLDTFRQANQFPLYFADDPHWSPLGHTVCATALFELLGPQGRYSIADDLDR